MEINIDLDLNKDNWFLPIRYQVISQLHIIFRFKRLLRRLNEFVDIEDVKVFRTNNGLHIYIRLGNLVKKINTQEELIILIIQSILDDDKFRQIHNLARILKFKKSKPFILFDRKIRFSNGKIEILREKRVRVKILERFFTEKLK